MAGRPKRRARLAREASARKNAGKKGKKLHYWTVTGAGAFPDDMLRYDQCSVIPSDVEVAEGTTAAWGHLRDWSLPLRTVTCVGPRKPTGARWASFGWTVGPASPLIRLGDIAEENPQAQKKKKKRQPLELMATGRAFNNPSYSENMRQIYKNLRISAFCYGMSYRDFDEEVRRRAAAFGGEAPDPRGWMAIAKEVHDDAKKAWEKDRSTESCPRCLGSGRFTTQIVNNKPVGPGGPCFRCDGKGFQNRFDRRRNCYYDIYGIPPGNLW